MSALEEKKLEAGINEDNQFDGQDLSPKDLRLKKLEIEMNKHIDTKLMQNPDKMPFAVWFIIPNELGERFCYYGLTPILKNFLKYQLGYIQKVDADALYHAFQGLCYYTPLLGSLLSDSYLDKFKTITILSSLYCFGFLLLTITSWPTVMGVQTTHLARAGPLFALLCICFGTGGIKPCVSAHGGDQFLDVQKYGLQKFYNYFYMAINAGALVSSYASPAIQKQTFFGPTPNDTLALWATVHAHPTGDGYPQAFLMLTIGMAFAVAVFVSGFKYYRVVPPKGEFILIDIFRTAFAYWNNRRTMSKEEAYKKTCETHTEGSVTEMMDLGKVIMAIWPSPIFWMAFNQNGTVWQDMGDQMAVPGGDKVNSFFDSETVNNIWNPFFIIILAPFVAHVLYPYLDKKFGAEKFGLMQRMVAGQLIAGVTFILAALIQKNVNANCYDGGPIDSCQSSTSIIWQILMYFFITVAEVLFSISGLNFTYIEVGKRTKSFCSALWLFTVGTGSFLTSAFLLGTIGDPNNTYWTRESFLYLVAGLCFAAGAIQYLISRWYVPKALRPTAHL